MNNPQQPNPQSNFQQPQSGSSKRLLIILSIVIGVLVILLGCGVFVTYLNVQKQAEEARIAREKAEEEKRVLQRSIEQAQRREEEEKRRREDEERKRKAEEERIAREEAERIEREEAEEKRQSEANTNANTLPANRAKGQVSNVTNKAEVALVDGELDAGFRVSGSVKNVGESGDLRVVAFLSCSEGEWRRVQNLYFRAGESMTLNYFFHEPTINATSCQARIGVSP